jgi:hypothetical protein
MEPMQIASILTDHPSATAFSALPDAPVVPHRERAALGAGSRLRLARALHRLGDAVAPATPPRRAWAGSR